ncbi:uncharacterized protein DUF4376 [Methylosinus sp. sav-2]|jgi:hypothetical protein|uniref:DUF4376 domain-containing protein n=1 Tax=Methylosinus sp. sav-2 TaxID=2485168 RepID=UPI000A642AE3|nr:DUF4376 domain-containing protein [Methylosinus sp. sav-2]TDX65647.1 uncharacterized protein DUF4376 [Methylosinus sp. sav-2]
MAYSIICDFAGEPLPDIVRRDADGALVPTDAQTSDSLAYRDWLGVGNAPTPLPIPTLAEAKRNRLAALAERRWRAEIAGASVNGLSLPTDEKTQAKLTAAVVASVLDNNYAVNWKLADGAFVAFDHATLIAVAQGVRTHVQSCFDREAQLVAAIVAAQDSAALEAIDIESAWPA